MQDEMSVTGVKSSFSPGLLWKQRRRRASLTPSMPLLEFLFTRSWALHPTGSAFLILVHGPGKTETQIRAQPTMP